MALVDYSDSESDNEIIGTKEAPKTAPAAKAAFQKAAPGKIKVDLPSIKPEPGQIDDQGADGRPAKRARIGGAFSGFNSFLPAPKQTAHNASKARVSLKTSSEAAFSRNPPPQPVEEQDHDGAQILDDGVTKEKKKDTPPPEEPKLVGKATRFLPLSVSNKKKKKTIAKPLPVAEPANKTDHEQNANIANADTDTDKPVKDVEAIPKPKRSLFVVQQEEEAIPISPSKGVYEPMMIPEDRAHVPNQIDQPITYQSSVAVNPNSLEATAADLNLTPAQRRHLFGRNGGKNANVMHFNLDNEYAANEQARQAGEVIEHRAVKAIAPGKHSLQQLVNNARTQQDAMEDKWAEGRRNRGEGGSKYGWSG